MKFKKKIGIIGGMGPEATSLLYKHITAKIQTDFNSCKDDEFPEIFIHNLPIPNIVNSIENNELTKKQILKSLKIMNYFGADIIVYPCNTLSYYYDFMVQNSNAKVIDIVQETCDYIKKNDISNFVLLSTKTTFDNKLYHKELNDIDVIPPYSQDEISNLIVKVLKGKKDVLTLMRIIDNEKKKSKNIVLGCTELSVLAEDMDIFSLVDPLIVLTDSIIGKIISKENL